MSVTIGVDPHKATHTAVAISGDEHELGRKKVRSSSQQADNLLAWAEPFDGRTWAIESAGGLGYLLAPHGCTNRHKSMNQASPPVATVDRRQWYLSGTAGVGLLRSAGAPGQQITEIC